MDQGVRMDQGMRMYQGMRMDQGYVRERRGKSEGGGSRAVPVAAWEGWMPLWMIVKWPIQICVGLMLLLLLGGRLHAIIDGHTTDG